MRDGFLPQEGGMEGGRVKRCKVCRQPFEPRQPMQAVCGVVCAKELAVSIRGKAEKQAAIKQRKADRERKEKLKSRSELAREAQQAFNQWVRLRDAGKPCGGGTVLAAAGTRVRAADEAGGGIRTGRARADREGGGAVRVGGEVKEGTSSATERAYRYRLIPSAWPLPTQR